VGKQNPNPAPTTTRRQKKKETAVLTPDPAAKAFCKSLLGPGQGDRWTSGDPVGEGDRTEVNKPVGTASTLPLKPISYEATKKKTSGERENKRSRGSVDEREEPGYLSNWEAYTKQQGPTTQREQSENLLGGTIKKSTQQERNASLSLWPVYTAFPVQKHHGRVLLESCGPIRREKRRMRVSATKSRPRLWRNQTSEKLQEGKTNFRMAGGGRATDPTPSDRKTRPRTEQNPSEQNKICRSHLNFVLRDG